VFHIENLTFITDSIERIREQNMH